MNKQKLYIFVGYPGAGKTTVSRLIAEKTGAVHLWADQERQTMFGKAHLSEDETAELYERLDKETEELLGQGKSVIFDTNFNFRKDREYLRVLAEKQGAELVLIWLQTSLATARERATELADGHDTRVWGNMPTDDFERISRNLEPPTDEESPIIIDGDKLDEAAIISTLSL